MQLRLATLIPTKKVPKHRLQFYGSRWDEVTSRDSYAVLSYLPRDIWFCLLEELPIPSLDELQR